jgi:hypothetical protein
VTLRRAKISTSSGSAAGCKNEIVTVRSDSSPACWTVSGWTLATTAASVRSSASLPATAAPAARKSSSVANDGKPAPLSTSTSSPARTIRGTTSGTSATRRSYSRVSAGMTTLTDRNLASLGTNPMFVSAPEGTTPHHRRGRWRCCRLPRRLSIGADHDRYRAFLARHESRRSYRAPATLRFTQACLGMVQMPEYGNHPTGKRPAGRLPQRAQAHRDGPPAKRTGFGRDRRDRQNAAKRPYCHRSKAAPHDW